MAHGRAAPATRAGCYHDEARPAWAPEWSLKELEELMPLDCSRLARAASPAQLQERLRVAFKFGCGRGSGRAGKHGCAVTPAPCVRAP